MLQQPTTSARTPASATLSRRALTGALTGARPDPATARWLQGLCDAAVVLAPGKQGVERTFSGKEALIAGCCWSLRPERMSLDELRCVAAFLRGQHNLAQLVDAPAQAVIIRRRADGEPQCHLRDLQRKPLSHRDDPRGVLMPLWTLQTFKRKLREHG